MNPAFSVLFLTTLIGAGQGLFLALMTAQSYALFDLLPPADDRLFYGLGSLLSLLLLLLGLLASFFHLGRPERAWRAVAQWRTSWLSREVIVLPAFMACVLLYGGAHYFGWRPVVAVLPGGAVIDSSVLLGGAGTLLAFALYVCTAMIYACLRFLREWHSPLTVSNFILLGGSSGFILAAAFATITAPPLVTFFTGWAIIITVLGAGSRVASLWRNGRLRPPSNLQTALGIKHPHIAQKTQGFMGGAFNTREFRHGRAPGELRQLKWLFLALAFLLPILLLASAFRGGDADALWWAVCLQFPGLLAERWYFFAQANHPQNLYYQSVA